MDTNAAFEPREAYTTRDKLLDVAEAIVPREGVVKLTLDAVAREAGLSKGGVLYHFGTKDALVSALVTRLYESFERDIAREVDVSPDAPGRWTRAYVAATVAPDSLQAERTREVGAGLLAAIASDPDLLEPLRARYNAWQERLEHDGIDPALATLARLAVDGLWLAELFGLAPPAPALQEKVLAALYGLTEEDKA